MVIVGEVRQGGGSNERSPSLKRAPQLSTLSPLANDNYQSIRLNETNKAVRYKHIQEDRYS